MGRQGMVMGGKLYEEGALLGAGAFGIATLIVTGVGTVGLGYLYTHPQVVDGFRSRSVSLREKLDGSLGVKLRKFSDSMRRSVGISPEKREILRDMTRSSIGMRSHKRE